MGIGDNCRFVSVVCVARQIICRKMAKSFRIRVLTKKRRSPVHRLHV